MKFTATQDFTSLAELMRFYSDADEIVFKSHCQLDESEIVELCHRARHLANRMRLRHGSQSAEEIAAGFGCKILREAWQVAEGKIIYLAECSSLPRADGARIRVNTEAVTSLAGLMAQWANDEERELFTEAKIIETAIAHELFHLVEQRPPSTAVELEAHAFARAFTAHPFSPLLYSTLLARLAKERTAGRI